MEQLEYLDIINMETGELISVQTQVRGERLRLERLEYQIGSLLIERLSKPTERYTYD